MILPRGAIMQTWRVVIRFGVGAAVSALVGRRLLNCLWELTYRCNARCAICPYWRRPSEPALELTADQIREGLGKIHAYGCRLVNFTGGEPTLRSDLEEIISEASRLGIWTSMVTNGSLITRGRLRSLKSAGLDHLLISLDSADPVYHDHHRGIPGSHAKVIEGLRWIGEDFLTGHRTGGIMCAISAGNLDQVPALAELARSLGVHAVFQPYSYNKTGDDSLTPHIGTPQVSTLMLLKRRDSTVLNSRRYLEGWVPDRRSRCSAGKKYFSIDPYGYLHPCVDTPAAGHILRDDIQVIRSDRAANDVATCQGCWYCFRGEADTSLSVGGYLEKVGIGLAVIRRNLARTLRSPSRTRDTA